MRGTVSRALVFVAAITCAGSMAEALTFQDIVELSQAGVGDQVLIELIEMDTTPFTLPPSVLRGLKQAGVSDNVLLALVRTGNVTTSRNPSTECLGASFSCQPGTPTATVPIQIPLVVPVPVPVRRPRVTPTESRPAGPLNPFGFAGVSGFSSLRTVSPGTGSPRPGDAPVYWGWGGEKRPGSWDGHSGQTP